MSILDTIFDRIDYLQSQYDDFKMTHEKYEMSVYLSIESVRRQIEMKYGEENWAMFKEFLLKYAGLIR